jgi:hypothetical protein
MSSVKDDPGTIGDYEKPHVREGANHQEDEEADWEE